MTFYIDHIETIYVIITSLVTAASAVANLTKTDKDNKAVGYISKAINFIALNLDKVYKNPNKVKYND